MDNLPNPSWKMPSIQKENFSNHSRSSSVAPVILQKLRCSFEVFIVILDYDKNSSIQNWRRQLCKTSLPIFNCFVNNLVHNCSLHYLSSWYICILHPFIVRGAARVSLLFNSQLKLSDYICASHFALKYDKRCHFLRKGGGGFQRLKSQLKMNGA